MYNKKILLVILFIFLLNTGCAKNITPVIENTITTSKISTITAAFSNELNSFTASTEQYPTTTKVYNTSVPVSDNSVDEAEIVGEFIAENKNASIKSYKSYTLIFQFPKRLKDFYSDVKLFYVDLILPEEWSLEKGLIDSASFAPLMWSYINIYSNGVNIGAIAANLYNTIPGTDNPTGRYSQVMTNHYTWHIGFTPLTEANGHGSAVTDVYYSAILTRQEKKNKGVLSYSDDLLKYIGIEIENDCVSVEQLKEITESIKLHR